MPVSWIHGATHTIKAINTMKLYSELHLVSSSRRHIRRTVNVETTVYDFGEGVSVSFYEILLSRSEYMSSSAPFH
jgi:hypothetical protein